MAGQKAAQAAATWPFINGDLLPPSVMKNNIFYHSISIHFVHRTLAFIIVCFGLYWTWQLRKVRKLRHSLLPIGLIVVQVLLGVLTIISSPKAVKNGWGIFEWNAQLHQLVAMCLLLSLVYFLFVLGRNRK
jgi:cytochrome c oxidase assembly protein subunit 15